MDDRVDLAGGLANGLFFGLDDDAVLASRLTVVEILHQNATALVSTITRTSEEQGNNLFRAWIKRCDASADSTSPLEYSISDIYAVF